MERTGYLQRSPVRKWPIRLLARDFCLIPPCRAWCARSGVQRRPVWFGVFRRLAMGTGHGAVPDFSSTGGVYCTGGRIPAFRSPVLLHCTRGLTMFVCARRIAPEGRIFGLRYPSSASPRRVPPGRVKGGLSPGCRKGQIRRRRGRSCAFPASASKRIPPQGADPDPAAFRLPSPGIRVRLTGRQLSLYRPGLQTYSASREMRPVGGQATPAYAPHSMRCRDPSLRMRPIPAEGWLPLTFTVLPAKTIWERPRRAFP